MYMLLFAPFVRLNEKNTFCFHNRHRGKSRQAHLQKTMVKDRHINPHYRDTTMFLSSKTNYTHAKKTKRTNETVTICQTCVSS